MPWTATNPAARCRRLGTVAAILLLAGPLPAPAQTRRDLIGLEPIVAEAAQRFALPPSWITGVMRRESAFQAVAVSHAGALGLMQIMPRTYSDLQLRYGLGADPLQPHDNVLAGAAYLRELYDRFGQPGFLAAYNAGPARYMQSLIDGRPLPAETLAYTRQLDLDLDLQAGPASILPAAPSVFVALAAFPQHTSDLNPASLAPPAALSLFAPISGVTEEAYHGR